MGSVLGSYTTDLLNQVQPVLADALERMDRTDASAIDDARRAVLAAARFAKLYTPPEHVFFNAPELFRENEGEFVRPGVSLHVEVVSECAGDVQSVLACVAILVAGAELAPETDLEVEVFEENGVPLVTLSLIGPGKFPTVYTVDGYFRLSLQEIGDRWTIATRGGRLEVGPNGLVLRLKGARMPKEPVPGLDGLRAALDTAITASDREGLRHGIEGALAACEGAWGKKAPADVKALISECISSRDALLDGARLQVEQWIEPELPPLMVDRSAMVCFLSTTLDLAVAALPEGGSISLLADYAAPAHEVGLVIGLNGRTVQWDAPYHLAGMRRAVSVYHGGTYEAECDGRSATVTCTLPDPVGAALTQWIPGYEAFTPRSRQMLRLLKSQPGALPEAVLLDGVLEEELERWLLPRLASPIAVNVAREVDEQSADALKSPESLQKALGQVKKEKVRKEIAQPKYAAELLWAFRKGDRARAAIGSDRLTPEDLEALCRCLGENPVSYVDALRLIAKAIA